MALRAQANSKGRVRTGSIGGLSGVPGQLFGQVFGFTGLRGGLTNSLKGSVSAGAVLAGSLTLQRALAGTIASNAALTGALTAASPVALDLPFSTMSSGSDLTAKGVTFTGTPTFDPVKGVLIEPGVTLSMTGTNFSSWYNQSEGTFVVDVTMPGGSYLAAIINANSSTFQNSNGIWRSNSGVTDAGNNIVGSLYNGTAATSVPSGTGDPGWNGGTLRLAYGYALGSTHLAINGDLADVGEQAGPTGTMPAPTQFFIGSREGSFPLSGYIKSIKYYNTRKTNTELKSLSAIPPNLSAITGVVFEGDSLMAGATTTNGPISALYASATGQGVTNSAVGGDTLANMANTFSTDIAPVYNAATRNTLFVEGGTNDIGLYSATLTSLQGSVEFMSNQARVTGFIVVVSTIPPRGDGVNSWTSDMEALRQSYNAWLRANYTIFADRIVDLATIPILADPSNTTYYNVDKTHWTNATNVVVTQAIRDAFGT